LRELLATALALVAASPVFAAVTIDTGSLLRDLHDLGALPILDDSRCRQFSSHNREGATSKIGDRTYYEANVDRGHFLSMSESGEAVLAEIPAQAAALERADLIARSLREQGALVLVRDLPQAAALASALAPEHLELAVEYPEALAERIENAGCIFLGHLAAVPLGDYAAGPSHVLPTGGTARFSSPLSVHDFLKRTSLVEVTEQGLRRIGPDTLALAEAEGLTAHAAAVRKRLEG